MPVIAPWLDTKPTDFARAAEAGARIGMERQAQAAQAQEASARIQTQAAEAAQQQQIERERIAAEQAMAQQRNQMSAQQAARKFQSQQAYQQAIASGMDPSQALMMHGPSMGVNVDPLALQFSKLGRAEIPPKMITDPTGRTIGVTYAGGFHPVPQERQAKTPPQFNKFEEMEIGRLNSQLKKIDETEAKIASTPIDALNADSVKSQARALRLQRSRAEQKLEEYRSRGKDGTEEAPQEPAAPKPSGQKTPDLPNVGDVVDGYTLIGLPRSKQSNWVKVEQQSDTE